MYPVLAEVDVVGPLNPFVKNLKTILQYSHLVPALARGTWYMMFLQYEYCMKVARLDFQDCKKMFLAFSHPAG